MSDHRSLPRNVPLRPQQKNIALLRALLYSTADIAAETGYSVGYVNEILRRADMQALVRQYESDRIAGQRLAVQTTLMEDAPANLKAIQLIRDQNLGTQRDDAGNTITGDHRVALSAATVLFDRQVPRITKHEEEKHIHIHLSREEQAAGASVLEEEQLLDMEESQLAIEDAEEVEAR